MGVHTSFKPMMLSSVILSIIVSAFSYVTVLYLIRQRRARQENC